MASLRLRSLWIGLVIVVGTGMSGGCAIFGGGGPDIQRAKNYSVKAPSDWKATDKADSDQAYRLSTGNIATVTSSCNRNADAPLEILTKHLLIGSRNIVVEDRKRIDVKGTEGLFSRVKATFEKSPFELLLFVLPKGGCIFDFTLVTPKTVTERETQEFLSFVQSFSYGKN